jgi:hypothetical protein
MRLQRYRLYRRNGTFYAENVESKKQESLRTKDKQEALVLLGAKNEASRQPALNLRIARTYMLASDPLMSKRTWRHVLDEIIKTTSGPTQYRWTNVAKDKAIIPLLGQKLTDTVAEDLLRALAGDSKKQVAQISTCRKTGDHLGRASSHYRSRAKQRTKRILSTGLALGSLPR